MGRRPCRRGGEDPRLGGRDDKRLAGVARKCEEFKIKITTKIIKFIFQQFKQVVFAYYFYLFLKK
jgi:hypothetical protein